MPQRFTLKKVPVAAFLKWHVALSLLTGFFAGVIYSAIYALVYREETYSYLFWYGLGMPLFYGLVAGFSGALGAWLYNKLNGVFGGVKFEFEADNMADTQTKQ